MYRGAKEEAVTSNTVIGFWMYSSLPPIVIIGLYLYLYSYLQFIGHQAPFVWVVVGVERSFCVWWHLMRPVEYLKGHKIEGFANTKTAATTTPAPARTRTTTMTTAPIMYWRQKHHQQQQQQQKQ